MQVGTVESTEFVFSQQTILAQNIVWVLYKLSNKKKGWFLLPIFFVRVYRRERGEHLEFAIDTQAEEHFNAGASDRQREKVDEAWYMRILRESLWNIFKHL